MYKASAVIDKKVVIHLTFVYFVLEFKNKAMFSILLDC